MSKGAEAKEHLKCLESAANGQESGKSQCVGFHGTFARAAGMSKPPQHGQEMQTGQTKAYAGATKEHRSDPILAPWHYRSIIYNDQVAVYGYMFLGTTNEQL